MKVHDPDSRLVLAPALEKGDVVEPGYLHCEQVTIDRVQKVADSDDLYSIVSKLDNGAAVLAFASAGDGVWVLPPSAP